MFRPIAHLRLRLLIALIFVIAGFAPVLGISAQSDNSFALTGVEFHCKTETSDVPRINFYYEYSGEIASGFASLHNTSTNFSASLDFPPGAFWDYDAWIAIQLTSDIEKLDTLFLRVVMSGENPLVYEYTVQLGPCGGASYAIGGGLVSDDTDNPQFPIAINNLTCTGFDWSVSAPYEVTVYVSVMDVIGQNMIPFVPVNGTELSRTETFAVTTENQTNFNVLITVYDIDTDQELARSSMSRTCPIAIKTPVVSPSETPGVPPPVPPSETPGVTPDVDDQVENTTIIQVQMPNGESIVDAPWDLYAPSASMQAGLSPLQSGVVGANNTITMNGLIEGQYRIVISPTGLDAIDFTFTVGSEPVTELLAVVNADGTVTVSAMQPDVLPTSVAPSGSEVTNQSAAEVAPAGSEVTNQSAADVSGLPSTGSGESASGTPVILFAILVFLTGLVGVAGSRHSSIGPR